MLFPLCLLPVLSLAVPQLQLHHPVHVSSPLTHHEAQEPPPKVYPIPLPKAMAVYGRAMVATADVLESTAVFHVPLPSPSGLKDQIAIS